MTDPSPESALLVGRYRLDTFLGEGGQAVVLKVHDTRLGVPRALKVLLPSCARKPRLRARFESEAQTMARIDHPNVVRVFDVDTEGAVPYFVMEYVRGGSLADRLAEGPLPPRLATAAAIQVCRGLAAAHELGVVHRDVKPHNVLVNAQGVCKVMDFGIAHLGDSRHKTKQGAAIGTQGYMAPEQATDATSVDRRSDLYGVGMTTYVLLTGRDPVEWLAGAHTGVVEPLRAVIARATATRKEDRPDDAEALAALFEAALDALPPDPPGAGLARSGEAKPADDDDEDDADRRLAEVVGWFANPADDVTGASAGSDPGLTPASGSLSGSLSSGTPAVPAYTMSRPAARPKDAPAAAPDWLPPEPAQVAEAPPPPEPAPPPPEEPVFDPAILVKVAWVGVPLALVLALALGGLLWWRGTVRAEEARARAAATEQLVDVVKHRLPLVGALEALGSDPAALEALVSDFQGASEPRARAEAAVRLTEHVDAELHRLVDPNSAQWASVAGPLDEMKVAVHRWRVAIGELPPDPEPPPPPAP